MQASHARKRITASLLFLFSFVSLWVDSSWAAQEPDTIVKLESYRFNDIFDVFITGFQNNFPKKSPSPEKDEFETTREYEARKRKWKKEYEKAVADYRRKFSETVPVPFI